MLLGVALMEFFAPLIFVDVQLKKGDFKITIVAIILVILTDFCAICMFWEFQFENWKPTIFMSQNS